MLAQIQGLLVHQSGTSDLQDAHLLHPNPGLVNAEQVPHELPEVDASVGLKEECELVSVELVLGVKDVHGERALLDLCTFVSEAELEGLWYRRLCRLTPSPLRLPHLLPANL